MTSWIEKNISKNLFISGKNYQYNFEEYFDLLLKHYNFAKKNIKKNEKIVFISNSVLEYSIFSILIPMVGGIFVPMNPKSPVNEIKNKMEIIKCKKIIYDKSIKLEAIENKIQISSEKLVPKNYKFEYISEDQVYCILFTSGSSGIPKAVNISRKNIETSCEISQLNLQVEKSDSWLLCMPPFHAGGLSIIFRSVILGNKFHVEDHFEADNVINLIMSEKINIISMVPTMLSRIVNEMEIKKISAPKSFKFILCGGARTSEDLILRANNIGLKILPTYGMTETSSQIATASPNDNERPKNSVGKLLEKVSIDFSSESEILISGDFVAKYYGKKDNSKWLYTGDYGYIDKNNYLFISGRLDDLIISGGENINPIEIEEIINKLDYIDECIVVGKKDEYWGEKVTAVVFSEKNIKLDEIKGSLENIDNYKHPKSIINYKKALPKLQNGKFDRKKIKEIINEL